MNPNDSFALPKHGGHPLKDARKEAIFAELHSLLGSGLDFSRSFSLLIEGERDAQTKALLAGLYRSVVRGEALARAFERSGRFAPLDCGVLRIGEQTGRLDEALAFLADYYRKRIAQRRTVSGAVSYPLIILFTAIVVVIFMVLVIVPMFEQVYSRMGGELPAMTRRIISLSDRRGARGCGNPIVVEDLWRPTFRAAVRLRMAAEDSYSGRHAEKERAGPFLPAARPARLLRSPAVAGHRDARGDHRVLSLPHLFCPDRPRTGAGSLSVGGAGALRGPLRPTARHAAEGGRADRPAVRNARPRRRRTDRRARAPPPLAGELARTRADSAGRPARGRHTRRHVPAHVPSRRNHGITD